MLKFSQKISVGSYKTGSYNWRLRVANTNFASSVAEIEKFSSWGHSYTMDIHDKRSRKKCVALNVILSKNKRGLF